MRHPVAVAVALLALGCLHTLHAGAALGDPVSVKRPLALHPAPTPLPVPPSAGTSMAMGEGPVLLTSAPQYGCCGAILVVTRASATSPMEGWRGAPRAAGPAEPVLVPGDTQAGSGFGTEGLAVAGAGHDYVVAVGAPRHPDDAGVPSNVDVGVVWVYVPAASGPAGGWQRVARLTASDASSNARFGHDVAASVAPYMVAVGAPGANSV